MIRRFFSMTGGFILGVAVTMAGLYLVPLRASDGPAKPWPNKNAPLPARVAALEERVQALESKSGIQLIQAPDGKLLAPPTWPNDGFGPVRVIPVESFPR
jgi:hypothetical protein